MTTVITYSRNGYKSVPTISKAMKEKHVVHRMRKGSKCMPDVGLLIRWGSRVRYPARKTINKSYAIGTSSNKGGARAHLTLSNVAVPKTIPLCMVGMGIELNYPVVVRPNRHQGGEEFHLLDSEKKLELFKLALFGDLDWYVSEYYDKTAEYRVHVAHGRALFVNQKLAREGEEYRYKEPVWNHCMNNFYFQVVRQSNWPLDVVRLAIQAVKALGLDYAGVDILAGAGDAVVCELNTAPSTENYSSQKYARYFDWLTETGGGEPHFDMPDAQADYKAYVFEYTIGGAD